MSYLRQLQGKLREGGLNEGHIYIYIPSNALGGLTQTGLGIARQNAGKCWKMPEYPLDSLQS